jgi:hypothetical protein
MLLATMVVLLQFPIAPAAKLPGQPQGPATALYAENTPAKLTPPNAPENPFAAPTNDLFDRDKIRLVDLPGVAPAAIGTTAADGTSRDGKSPDATKTTAMNQPSGESEESSSLLAEVHIPTRVEPPDPNYHPGHIDAERPGHTWLALSVASHGAATFDAWSTNRAIGQGHTEMNPMLRPFAGNASMYAAVQVGPLLFDYIGRRMQRSDKRWAHQIWWLPQSLSTAASLFAGAHNVAVSK